ncbi:MAG: TetR family transcriptional regulator [Armatimonadetes bacterium]|nr:TetR family transcriptional regulator [Armatimonadota bacterium]
MKARRSEIMQVAYDMLGQSGLEAVHARTVAQAVGINHATVHYYFPRRTDLLVGVAEHALNLLRADRAKFQEGLKSAEDKIEGELALAEAYSKPTSRFGKVLAGLTAAATSEPEVKDRINEIWREWTGELTPHLAKAKLRKSTPYRDADLLVGSLFGFIIASHLTDGAFNAQAKIDEVFTSMFG